MIPSTNTILSQDLEVETLPSKNYKMQIEHDVINGFCDELEAMKQVVFKILNTERYQYIIYSWNYGVELQDLFGKPMDYVMAELERRITEALVQDDRINAVDSFEFEEGRKKLLVTFTVHTKYGDVQGAKEVDV